MRRRIIGQTCCAFVVFLMICAVPQPTSFAADPSFRMPTYANAAPPAPRSRGEVEKLMAGSDEKVNADTSDSPLRIVLVAGPKDHGKGEHDYPAWQKVWSRLLAEAPTTKVDTAWEFPSADQMKDADVGVFYQHGSWSDERAAAVDPFLARGGGLVYIHWAVDGREQREEMAKRIGLSSFGGKIKYRHGELNVDFSPGESDPITRNFKNVRWFDESYWTLTGDPKRINLLGTCVEDDKPQPLFWTIEHGRGRVFVSIPGHFAWTFDDPAFRLLLLRGIAWAGPQDVDRFNTLVFLDARVQ